MSHENRGKDSYNDCINKLKKHEDDMNNVTKFGLIGLVLTSFMFLVGCNTVSGFGKDVSKSGEAISHVAKPNKHKR
jgi:predicted small secreted protein